MITAISLYRVPEQITVGDFVVYEVIVTATFTTEGDSDDVSVMSLRSVGMSVSPTRYGPFVSGYMSSLELPACGPSLTSQRSIWVMAGGRQGAEFIRLRSNSIATVEGTIEIDVQSAEPPEPATMRADGIFASTSSFLSLDSFEDRELLRGFWHGMALGASDLMSRAVTAEQSMSIFKMPVFSTRKWQKLRFDDAVGSFDGQYVVFGVTSDGDHVVSSADADVLAHHNVDDPLETLIGTAPTAFLSQPGTSALDAGERDQLSDDDDDEFHLASGIDGTGPMARFLFTFSQESKNIAAIRLNLVGKGWGEGGLSSGAISEIWNWEDETWDVLHETDEAQAEPAEDEQMGSTIHGDDIALYVNSDRELVVRIRVSAACVAGAEPNLKIDMVSAHVGAVGIASVAIESPIGTPVTQQDMAIAAWSSDGTELEEDADFFVDFDNERIVYLGDLSEPAKVLVVYDKNFPYAYKVNEDLVATSELRNKVASGPVVRMRDGVDYTIRRPGLLRCSVMRHYPGSYVHWWSPVSLHEEQLIYKNFGHITARLDDEASSVRYLRRIQGLWYAFWSGPSIRNIESGAQILLNAPFAYDQARVISINGNTLRLTNGQVVNKPTSTPWAVRLGQVVRRFQPLTKGARIVDRYSEPGFLGSAFSQEHIEDLTTNPDTPAEVARAVVSAHFFTAEIDGSSLAAGGASTALIDSFMRSIKPVHTYHAIGVVLRADCGHIVRGPCGVETDGNCLCAFAPPPYDLPATVSGFYELDLTELLTRWPFLNVDGGVTPNLVTLAAISGQVHGDAVYVTSEGSHYIWYEPQAVPGPSIDLGRYFDEDGVAHPRIPDLHPGYLLQDWSSGSEEEVAQDAHSAGYPPYDQWQAGGRWVKMVHNPFDLPRRANYSADLAVNDGFSNGTVGSGVMMGTAKDEFNDDVPARSGSWSTLAGATIAAGQVGLTAPVTHVRSVWNVSLDRWIQGSHYDVDMLAGTVTFDPIFEYDPIGNPSGTWAEGHLINVIYRIGFAIRDTVASEAGYTAATSYEARSLEEEPTGIGEPWHRYDEAYDLGGDFPSAVIHFIGFAKNADIELGNYTAIRKQPWLSLP